MSVVLRVATPSHETSYELEEAEYRLGRSPESDIRVDVETVSRQQARLVRAGEGYVYVQVGRTNPTFFRGEPVDRRSLEPGDRLEIAPGTPHAVSLVYEAGDAQPALAALGQTLRGAPIRSGDLAPAGAVERLQLPASGDVSIGRAQSNDLVLPSLHVSRSHAQITVSGEHAVLADAGSANGTYVNGVRSAQRVLAEGDTIRIGPYKLAYRAHCIEHIDDSRTVRLDAHDICKDIGSKVLLNHVTFAAQPGEVLAIAGTSGAGKSTLLDALNGMRPPTSGHVFVNGADLYRAYDALRPLIGYVPQESILPLQLPVQRALSYVAKLRMPPDVTASDQEERVIQVMRQLEIEERAGVRIDRLSGGQQKRASIAAELISSPGLFFLDEPTSGLDPGLTRRVTEIVRGLARSGATIVMISHDVESLEASDRVLFLGSGGRVVFFGPASDALTYFAADDIAEIYRRVESEDAASWQTRWTESAYYQENVRPRLVSAERTAGEQAHEQSAATPSLDPFALIGEGVRGGGSLWRQFWISTARYVDTLLRDRMYLAILLAQAPIIALFAAIAATPADLRPPPAEAVNQAEAFGVPAATLATALPVILAATATWFGAINAARELVKEIPIYLRERMAGLRLGPYLASKLVVLSALCIVQTTLLLAIIALRVDLPSSGPLFWAPLELWITLNLAALAALALGLLISASVSNANRAQSLVPIVLIPQLIFIGGPEAGTIGKWLSYLTVTHWSVEAIKISCGIPYLTEVGGFSAGDLLARWGALVLMMLVLLIATTWQVSRRRAG